MSLQKTFKGYGVTDENWTKFSLVDYPSKKWTEKDVEIAISHCGVCGSDIHTISQGWGEIEFPLVVGHEIVGKAVRVGSEVKGIKVGDRVGVGAQIASCYECKYCETDNENYCPKGIDTYGAKYPDGVRTMGGYSNGIIANERFVFPIPDGVESEHAASMLCAGLTVYSPLIRNGVGPGSKVGIVGIGGLGHYALLFANALGAKVTAFSHSDHKQEDAKKLGAPNFVVTREAGFHKEHALKFDVIISTVNVSEGFPLNEYLSMLTVHGKFITVGIPEQPLPSIPAMVLVNNGCFFGGSHIGSKKEALSMLKLAAEKGIKPWVELLPMKDVTKAVEGVRDGKPRYRYVLVQDL